MNGVADIVDPSVLGAMRAQIGDGAAARVVTLFKTDVSRRLGLFAGLAPAQAAREAHAIKGSARATGAVALAEAANRLELDAAGLTAAEIGVHVDGLRTAFEAAGAALDALLLPSSNR